jgi:hypothetical protein
MARRKQSKKYPIGKLTTAEYVAAYFLMNQYSAQLVPCAYTCGVVA